MQKQTQTIVVNNFGGRLTRILNGDLNSGFAKFDSSFGYDPFTKPMNLTWLGQPTSVIGIDPIGGFADKPSDVIVAGVNYAQGGDQTTSPNSFLLGTNNTIYQVTESPTTFSVIAKSSITGTYGWGGSIEFFGNVKKLYISDQSQIITTGSVTGTATFALDGSQTIVANSSIVGSTFHPLKRFAGKLIFGNGPSIGAIDATGTVISSVFTINNGIGNQYSQLSPALPSNQWVRDLEISQDGNYLYLAASSLLPEALFVDSTFPTVFSLFERSSMVPGEGAIYGWNGVDQGVTTALSIPQGTPWAMQVYLQDNRIFFNDSFGAAMGTLASKTLTMPKNKSPMPNATGTNGNFVTWSAPETTPSGKRVATLYYYGSLDEENPSGLYRLLRWETPLENGVVYSVPYQALVRNAYSTIASVAGFSSLVSMGSHIISTYSISSLVQSTASVGTGKLLQFEVTNSSTFPPQLGVYETQTQLFSKRTGLSQIRVYTEPVVAGNGFQLDIIGVDGTPVDNGTFTYTFGDPVDKEERINFNPNIAPQYGMGIRITNTGTTNMTIKKIELDVSPEGK